MQTPYLHSSPFTIISLHFCYLSQIGLYHVPKKPPGLHDLVLLNMFFFLPGLVPSHFFFWGGGGLRKSLSWQQNLLPYLGFPSSLAESSALSSVFPGGSDAKESACNVGNLGLILRFGRSPGEKVMVICSSVIVWEIPWTEESEGATVHGLERVRHDWVTNIFISLSSLAESVTLSSGPL